MIAFIIFSLLAVLFYLLWRTDRQAKPLTNGTPSGKVSFWLLIGLLSVFALLSPRIRDKINDLRNKLQ